MSVDLKKRKNNLKNESNVIQQNQFSVALIGRTNVGKSTLYNRLVGRRDAIVSRIEGTTRDRREGIGTVSGIKFGLVDTGGYVSSNDLDLIEEQVNQQTTLAIQYYDVLFFMIDGKVGVTPEDKHIASVIRGLRQDCQKNVYVVVNKTEGVFSHVDDEGRCSPWDALVAETSELGFGEPIGISAEHGEGLSDIFGILSPYANAINMNKRSVRKQFQEAIENEQKNGGEEVLSDDSENKDVNTLISNNKLHEVLVDVPVDSKDIDNEKLQLTVIGIPNSGKSTLLNKLLGENRFVTGDIPGLTRDVVSTDIQYNNRSIRVVDTPGIPKGSSTLPPSLTSLSVFHALRAVQYSHIVALILDGARELSSHDISLAKEVLDKKRGLFLVLNKSDLIPSISQSKKQLMSYIDRWLPQGGNVCSVIVSALNGNGVERIFPLACEMFDRWRSRISTGHLNRWLSAITFKHPHPRRGGRQVKLKYMTQTKARPPTFVVFSNTKKLDEGYVKFLQSSLRDEFTLHGIPMTFLIRVASNPFSPKEKSQKDKEENRQKDKKKSPNEKKRGISKQ